MSRRSAQDSQSLPEKPLCRTSAGLAQPANSHSSRPQRRPESTERREDTQKHSNATGIPVPPASNVTGSRAVLLNLLQISDSAFPISGFTHSGGVEAAWRRGAVPCTESLQRLLKTCILTICSQQVPYVVAAHTIVATLAAEGASSASSYPPQSEDSAKEDDLPEWALQLTDLDRTLSVSMSNHVSRRASLQQGRSLLSLAIDVFPNAAPLKQLPPLCPNGLASLTTSSAVGNASHSEATNSSSRKLVFEGHLAVVFGAVCALLGVQRNETVDTFAFSALRNCVSAAVRLGRIGSVHAQRLQNDLSEFCLRTAQRYSQKRCGQEDHQSAPILDVYQNSQDQLFTKMFYS
ncbi:urease accessory protein UreF-like [Tropilaelaps mercedesae]|uniref:Urease accessory protein UreF-like n=1 Tax=Tropilaelaps mercedesae TaxID=418985 RepID=A0A1V9XVG5_9ACAR|nr:urease accessory protein UreF-like [Tropilaelaps mercedesae]